MQWFRRFKRNPDAKWKLKPEFIHGGSLRKLFENCKTRRKNGLCCSILPSENQDQIAKFLATDIGKEFNFVKIKILASESGFDGFYMALLERKEEILKPKEIKLK
jgi:16S rRNA (cytosine967-C5)-methyltransferase